MGGQRRTVRELVSFLNGVIKEYLDPEISEPEYEDFVEVLLRIQEDPSQSTISNDENVKGVLVLRIQSFLHVLLERSLKHIYKDSMH